MVGMALYHAWRCPGGARARERRGFVCCVTQFTLFTPLLWLHPNSSGDLGEEALCLSWPARWG